MSMIIDRRSSGTRSAANHDRLNRRVRARLKAAVEKVAQSGSIPDLASGEKPVRIPGKDLAEPSFRRDWSAGGWERALPGNKEFGVGDQIRKPQGGDGGGRGREGSPEGLGDDELDIVLSADEFLDLLFDGLALPHLRDLAQGEMESSQWQRAGFVKDGSPSRMHVGRTMRTARARRLALRAGKKRELKELTDAREALLEEIRRRIDAGQDVLVERSRLTELDAEITVLERKIKSIPFIDESDLRFAHSDQQPRPITHAVMICVMDVSGSMGEEEKDLAKRFFLLLYLFLKRHYRAVEMVFIKHHTVATEASEAEFFGAREGGGTLVSPALSLAQEIVTQRFPADAWNVYLAQASDGDNYTGDTPIVHEVLLHLLPQLRNLFYLEVHRDSESELLQLYNDLAEVFPELITARAMEREDIYPLFRALFGAEEAAHA